MATYRGDGTPTAGDDFPTTTDLETAVADAEQSATEAEASATSASTSEANAATSETNAATSASESASSATDSANSASAAATSEANAATSETNAATSASNAATSETNAAQSASDAQGSADDAAASAATNNLPALTSGDVGKNIKVNATWDGYEFDVTIPHTDVANVFTDVQTIEYNYPTLFLKDTGSTDLNYKIQADAGFFGIFLANDAGAFQDWKFRCTDDADMLYAASGVLQYSGENVVTEDRANTFSKKIIIDTISPVLLLNENDQTDKNWGFFGTAGDGYIGLFNDAGVNTTTMIRMAPTADQLYLTSGDIEYDGNTIRSYCGRTDALATGYAAPNGWTIAKIGTGHLRITHNLNSYPVMVATPEANAERASTIVHTSLNAIDIYTRQGATLTDTGVSFMCQETT